VVGWQIAIVSALPANSTSSAFYNEITGEVILTVGSAGVTPLSGLSVSLRLKTPLNVTARGGPAVISASTTNIFPTVLGTIQFGSGNSNANKKSWTAVEIEQSNAFSAGPNIVLLSAAPQSPVAKNALLTVSGLAGTPATSDFEVFEIGTSYLATTGSIAAPLVRRDAGSAALRASESTSASESFRLRATGAPITIPVANDIPAGTSISFGVTVINPTNPPASVVSIALPGFSTVSASPAPVGSGYSPRSLTESTTTLSADNTLTMTIGPINLNGGSSITIVGLYNSLTPPNPALPVQVELPSLETFLAGISSSALPPGVSLGVPTLPGQTPPPGSSGLLGSFTVACNWNTLTGTLIIPPLGQYMPFLSLDILKLLGASTTDVTAVMTVVLKNPATFQRPRFPVICTAPEFSLFCSSQVMLTAGVLGGTQPASAGAFASHFPSASATQTPDIAPGLPNRITVSLGTGVLPYGIPSSVAGTPITITGLTGSTSASTSVLPVTYSINSVVQTTLLGVFSQTNGTLIVVVPTPSLAYAYGTMPGPPLAGSHTFDFTLNNPLQPSAVAVPGVSPGVTIPGLSPAAYTLSGTVLAGKRPSPDFSYLTVVETHQKSDTDNILFFRFGTGPVYSDPVIITGVVGSFTPTNSSYPAMLSAGGSSPASFNVSWNAEAGIITFPALTASQLPAELFIPLRNPPFPSPGAFPSLSWGPLRAAFAGGPVLTGALPAGGIFPFGFVSESSLVPDTPNTITISTIPFAELPVGWHLIIAGLGANTTSGPVVANIGSVFGSPTPNSAYFEKGASLLNISLSTFVYPGEPIEISFTLQNPNKPSQGSTPSLAVQAPNARTPQVYDPVEGGPVLSAGAAPFSFLKKDIVEATKLSGSENLLDFMVSPSSATPIVPGDRIVIQGLTGSQTTGSVVLLESDSNSAWGSTGAWDQLTGTLILTATSTVYMDPAPAPIRLKLVNRYAPQQPLSVKIKFVPSGASLRAAPTASPFFTMNGSPTLSGPSAFSYYSVSESSEVALAPNRITVEFAPVNEMMYGEPICVDGLVPTNTPDNFALPLFGRSAPIFAANENTTVTSGYWSQYSGSLCVTPYRVIAPGESISFSFTLDNYGYSNPGATQLTLNGEPVVTSPGYYLLMASRPGVQPCQSEKGCAPEPPVGPRPVTEPTGGDGLERFEPAVQKNELTPKLAKDAGQASATTVAVVVGTAVSSSVGASVGGAVTSSVSSAAGSAAGGAAGSPDFSTMGLVQQAQFLGVMGNLGSPPNGEPSVPATANTFSDEFAWINYQFMTPFAESGDEAVARLETEKAEQEAEDERIAEEIATGSTRSSGSTPAPAPGGRRRLLSLRSSSEECDTEANIQLQADITGNIFYCAVILLGVFILRNIVIVCLRYIIVEKPFSTWEGEDKYTDRWRKEKDAKKAAAEEEEEITDEPSDDESDTGLTEAEAKKAAEEEEVVEEEEEEEDDPDKPWEVPLALRFPTWELPVVMTEYFGLCESAGTAFGSGCGHLIFGGVMLLIVLPLPFFIGTIILVRRTLHDKTAAVAAFEATPYPSWKETRERIKNATTLTEKWDILEEFKGGWENIGEWDPEHKKLPPPADMTDAQRRAEAAELYLAPTVGAYRGDRYPGYLTFYIIHLRMLIVGVIIGIFAVVPRSSLAFAIEGVESTTVALTQPYADHVSNVIEGWASVSKVLSILAMLLSSVEAITIVTAGYILFVALIVGTVVEMFGVVYEKFSLIISVPGYIKEMAPCFAFCCGITVWHDEEAEDPGKDEDESPIVGADGKPVVSAYIGSGVAARLRRKNYRQRKTFSCLSICGGVFCLIIAATMIAAAATDWYTHEEVYEGWVRVSEDETDVIRINSTMSYWNFDGVTTVVKTPYEDGETLGYQRTSSYVEHRSDSEVKKLFRLIMAFVLICLITAFVLAIVLFLIQSESLRNKIFSCAGHRASHALVIILTVIMLLSACVAFLALVGVTNAFENDSPGCEQGYCRKYIDWVVDDLGIVVLRDPVTGEESMRRFEVLLHWGPDAAWYLALCAIILSAVVLFAVLMMPFKKTFAPFPEHAVDWPVDKPLEAPGAPKVTPDGTVVEDPFNHGLYGYRGFVSPLEQHQGQQPNFMPQVGPVAQQVPGQFVNL